MQSPRSRFALVNQQIAQSKRDYRRRDAVKLIAVSKQQSAAKVIKLAKLGQYDFAENYVQEGIKKIAMCRQLLSNTAISDSLCWHFIGHIQTRKCRTIAENFTWVHSVDRVEIANKLNNYRTAHDPLNILIQVNLAGELSKAGVSEAACLPLAHKIAELPNLHLRGLMLIPPIEHDFANQRTAFRRCRELRDKIQRNLGDNIKPNLPIANIKLTHLSMGMSGDMQAAIAEGATLVRIGTALFGPRESTISNN